VDFEDYVGNLLAALASLRTFEAYFDEYDNPDDDSDYDYDYDCPIKDDLSFIKKVSDRAPRLKHIALTCHCYKRVSGEWVVCGLTGPFRSHSKGECIFDYLASTLCPGEPAARIFFDIVILMWIWH